MEQCEEKYAPQWQFIGKRTPSKAEDRSIVLPEGKIECDHIRGFLEDISWPPCISRGNGRQATGPVANHHVPPRFKGNDCRGHSR